MLQHYAVVRHVVGGIALEVAGDCPPDRGAVSLDPPAVTLQLASSVTSAPLRPSAVPLVEQDSWSGYLDGETVILCVGGPESPAGDVMRLELARHGLDGRLYFRAGTPPWPFCHPADQLLVIHVLGVIGGVLTHAAAIAGRDGAFLVAGPSGAGKTTMSRFAAALGARVLSDERTIVRPQPDAPAKWLLGGTPWPGEGGFAHNSSVPLRGLIFIEQADRDELVPLSPARALARLYVCHFPPVWDPEACERTLGHLDQLVREVPAFLFRNRKTPEGARQLLERLGGPP